MAIKRLKFCVDNQWRDSKTTKYMPITDSSTGKVIAETPCCTKDEVYEAIAAAKAAFLSWSNLPVQKRVTVMINIRNIFNAHLDELALLCATELGKTIAESRGDVLKAIEVCECAISTPYLMQGDSLMQASNGFDTTSYREPLGVFGAIVPFNFPGMIPWGWMIPFCITTGNTIVMKAASMTPMTSNRMMELAIEAGLHPGVINWVTTSRVEADILLTHPDVRGISFVGSTSVGLHVYSTAAAHGKRAQCLTEAKNHALVLRDAPIEAAARRIINSTYGCAGMRCMALPALVVEDTIADEFVDTFVKLAKEMKIGCAYDPSTDMGPVVSEEHKKFVISWIDKAEQEGAKLLLDGRNIIVPGFEGGHFVGPTIFDHVKAGMSCGDQEVFGPVTFIKRVHDFEEGLAIMNANRFANGSAIFTRDGKAAREFMRRTDGGMVGINVGIPVPVSYFPFSGHKQSFFGDLHCMGRDGVAFYTETKTVTTQWYAPGEGQQKVSTWEGSMNRE
ncbi:MAG: methylmalonate-semialdehyde dehydrogenase [Desulfosporosinus sp. BRH_c37]|nr:MAG: methylmalonate-semialdehyde dehydrogenase [Desulfosporosinus sp. BRH_c37]